MSGPTQGYFIQLFLSFHYKIISSLTIPTAEFPNEVKCSPSNALNSCKAFCISGLLLSMAIAFMGSVWTCDSAAVNLGSISNFDREGFPSIFFKRSSVIQSIEKKNSVFNYFSTNVFFCIQPSFWKWYWQNLQPRVEKGQKAGFLCQVRLKIPLTKKKERKNSKSEERERR